MADRKHVSREEARQAGATRYFTGEPCKRGHISERYVSTGQCAECQQLHKVADRPKHRETARAYSKSYYWANREERRAYGQAYDAANPEKKKAWFKAWYDRNREARAIQKAAERKADPEKFKASYKSWADANPEHVLANSRRRVARQKGAEGHHSGAEIRALLKQQKTRCAYCGASLKIGYHVDHIVPLSRGGSNWITNIQLTCADCNHRKWAKDPLVWARQLGKLL